MKSHEETRKDKNCENVKKSFDKKKYPKNRNKDSREPSKTVGYGNDPAWYYPDESIGAMFSNIPYNIPAGVKLPYPNIGSLTGNQFQTLPTFGRITYLPSYGYISMNDATAAVNVTARAVFSKIRKMNSGSANYESSDLMTYIMAMDQVYTFSHHIRKMLAFVGSYTFYNRDWPRYYFEKVAQVNYDDLCANYATYLGRFNLIVTKVNNQFAVPKGIKLFERRNLLATNLFADSTSARGQVWSFELGGYYEWTGTVKGGSSLTFVELNTPTGEYITMGELLDKFDALVSKLIAEQDLAIMSGDIVKAIGAENCYSLATYDGITPLVPVYNETVLQEIENAVVFCRPSLADKASWNILQKDNLLYCTPTLNYLFSGDIPGDTQNGFSRLMQQQNSIPINSHKDSPDWKDSLEFTRMAGYAKMEGFSEKGVGFTVHAGVEVIFEIATNYSLNTGADKLEMSQYFQIGDANGIASDKIAAMSELSKFDWHPILTLYYNVYWSGANIAGEFCGLYGEFKVFTVVPYATLDGMHDCAIMGLLDIKY